MGTRFCLGLAGVALVATLCGCGRARQTSDQAAPDTAMINASAALVEPSGGPRPAAAPDRQDCALAKTRGFVGKPDQPATRTALADAVGSRVIRWIKPGTAITQDMNPGRLNVIVSDDGRIEALRCG